MTIKITPELRETFMGLNTAILTIESAKDALESAGRLTDEISRQMAKADVNLKDAAQLLEGQTIDESDIETLMNASTTAANVMANINLILNPTGFNLDG